MIRNFVQLKEIYDREIEDKVEQWKSYFTRFPTASDLFYYVSDFRTNQRMDLSSIKEI